jgi:hypothetical protein
MKFDKRKHQKVRFDGQLYVVLLDEYPEFGQADENYQVVLHPVGNDWIVHIKNPQVRQYLTVRKGNSKAVAPTTME